ncbi:MULTISPECIES: rhomboid family intramembrane serine protease [Amniculibacterium]|jgi:membrane associated rhomboid family serine protease|uniref:rhomboid family intramembrane serine protease n=1 Tax=Amniculibacterium TaxID=2715289 RepID=UPI000F591B49|nr:MULTISPECIES: rhomboid family intramembrane serine protease [Amniculibacterium]
MNFILIAIIVLNIVISMKGFQDMRFFEKYKFNVAAVQRGEYIRLISAGFLHGSWSHLLFNMLTLYFFAPIAIQAFGEIGFLIIYLGSIILGNYFCQYLYKKQSWYSAIGASGGVSGVLFAAIAILPEIGIYLFFIPIPIPGYIFGAVYFGYSVYMMLNPNPQDQVGHAAHLGGAFFGLAYAVANQPEVAMSHSWQLTIMALPLIYLGYEIIVKKRIG